MSYVIHTGKSCEVYFDFLYLISTCSLYENAATGKIQNSDVFRTIFNIVTVNTQETSTVVWANMYLLEKSLCIIIYYIILFIKVT